MSTQDLIPRNNLTMGYIEHLPADVSNVPRNAKFLGKCGCYTTFISDCVDYGNVCFTMETNTIYHCAGHMNACNQGLVSGPKKLDESLVKKETNDNIWSDKCKVAEEAAEKERQALVKMMYDMKLTKLRKIKDVLKNTSWSCSIHHGFVTLQFTDAHSQFCPAQFEPISEYIRNGEKCSCNPISPEKFTYASSRGKYIFQRS